MQEFVVAGLLISPLVKCALLAGFVFLPVRAVLVHLRFEKWFWHPLLAEAAIFLCILATLDILV